MNNNDFAIFSMYGGCDMVILNDIPQNAFANLNQHAHRKF